MSFVWWVFGSLFIFLGLYYAFVAVDKHSAKKRRLQSGMVIQGNAMPHPQQPPPTMMQANQVIYTIPTTHQLAQQYPHMVQTGPIVVTHPTNQPPPYLDPPPTYDQVHPVPATTTDSTTPTTTRTAHQ